MQTKRRWGWAAGMAVTRSSLRHAIAHPTSILTDLKPPRLPLAVQIVGADGSETLVTVFPHV